MHRLLPLLLVIGCTDGLLEDPVDTDVDELVEPLAMPYLPTVDVSDFNSADTCARCHPTHVEQWSTSSHAYAMTDPVYRELVDHRQQAFDGKQDRFCLQCHSPVGTRGGEVVPGFEFEDLSPVVLEGVTCEGCHKISEVARPNNAGHVLDPKGPLRASIADPVPNAFHASDYSELHSSSELCGSCHDVVEATGLNLERPYEEWLESPAGEEGRTCQSCHMPGTTGPAAVDGPDREVHDHTWWTVDLPLAAGFLDADTMEAKAAVVQQMLSGSAALELDAPPVWPVGQRFDVTVEVRNLIDGHAFPTGSTFNRQVWVELVAHDSAGTQLFETGTLDANGDLRNFFSDLDPFGDDDLISLSSTLTDLDGNPTLFSWDASEHTSGALSPGYSRTFTLFVPTGAAVAGDVTIEARLRFRQLPPYLIRLLGQDDYLDQLRIFDVSTDSLVVELQ